MSGHELKCPRLSPLKIERIKWITILLLSHSLNFLFSKQEIKPVDDSLPEVRRSYVRLQLSLKSNLPAFQKPQGVILVSEEKELLSRDALLLKKINSSAPLESTHDEYLVELHQKDLPRLIAHNKEVIMAYPKTQNINFEKKEGRRINYEIRF